MDDGGKGGGEGGVLFEGCFRRGFCLLMLGGSNVQALTNTALDQFAIPGDASFPLNQAFEAPRDRQDVETLRQ